LGDAAAAAWVGDVLVLPLALAMAASYGVASLAGRRLA
jgi:hypothetical protein